MNIRIVILSEVSQTQKDKYHMILLISGILKKVNELIYKTEGVTNAELKHVYQRIKGEGD